MMMEIDLIEKVSAALALPGGATSDFDLNPGIELPAGRVLRDAAVLIPLMKAPTGVRVLLTKRSSALKHHPGQIAFPGGKRDGRESLSNTALREAEEEIGLPREQVRILGTLPQHETVTGFQVTPKVSVVEGGFTAIPEVGEVAEIFSVPLLHVLNPANYTRESRLWSGHQRYFYTVPYGPYYIWGATARILRTLADRVAA